jgi:hypothetical protein
MPDDRDVDEQARVRRETPKETSDDDQSRKVIGISVMQWTTKGTRREAHADHVDEQQHPRNLSSP